MGFHNRGFPLEKVKEVLKYCRSAADSVQSESSGSHGGRGFIANKTPMETTGKVKNLQQEVAASQNNAKTQMEKAKDHMATIAALLKQLNDKEAGQELGDAKVQ